MESFDPEDADLLDDISLNDAIDKARREWRLQARTLRDPGHLRRWCADRDIYSYWDIEVRSRSQFAQYMHGTKHSCHCYCCVYRRKEKREIVRRDRHLWRNNMGRLWKGLDA